MTHRARVLVAEDDVMIGFVIGEMLADRYEVKHAEHIQLTLNMLVRWRPDVLLLDYALPLGKSTPGTEPVRTADVEAAAQALRVRVIWMSGHPAAVMALQGKRLLAKPFTERELRDIVEGVLAAPNPHARGVASISSPVERLASVVKIGDYRKTDR